MENNILDEDFNTGNQQNDFNKETVKNINLAKIDLNEAIKQIKYGQGAFIILLFFTTVALVSTLSNSDDEELRFGMIFQSVIMYAIYIACLLGSYYNVKVAMTTGFSAYALLLLLDVILEPSSLFSGIIIKILMLSFMGQAVRAAFKIDGLLQKLAALGVPSAELQRIKQLKDLPRTQHQSELQKEFKAPEEQHPPLDEQE
ncbi:MAG: hypothetical protein AAF985_22490 [Bacteroidota bacterium]